MKNIGKLKQIAIKEADARNDEAVGWGLRHFNDNFVKKMLKFYLGINTRKKEDAIIKDHLYYKNILYYKRERQ